MDIEPDGSSSGGGGGAGGGSSGDGAGAGAGAGGARDAPTGTGGNAGFTEGVLCARGRYCPASAGFALPPRARDADGGVAPGVAPGVAAGVPPELPCPPGFYCREGSSAPRRCFTPLALCPAGSSQPLYLGAWLAAALVLLLCAALWAADRRRLSVLWMRDALTEHHAVRVRPRLRGWLARARARAAAAACAQPPPSPQQRATVGGLGTYAPIPPAQRVNVSVRGLTLTVDATRQPLLCGVSATFAPGTLTFIVGTSGCGKTTLLRALLGQWDASRMSQSGRITVCGVDATLDAVQRLVAFVPSGDLLPAGVAAHDALALAAALRCARDLPPRTRERRVEDLEAVLGLTPVRFLRIAPDWGLSSGQRKRLGIASELLGGPGAHPPPVLLLDEPTSSVDAATALKLMAFLKATAAACGCTIVCVIHQPRLETFALCDSVVLMSQGRVLFEGAPLAAAPYFRGLGYDPHPGANPCDFAMDVCAGIAKRSGRIQYTAETLGQLWTDRGGAAAEAAAAASALAAAGKAAVTAQLDAAAATGEGGAAPARVHKAGGGEAGHAHAATGSSSATATTTLSSSSVEPSVAGSRSASSAAPPLPPTPMALAPPVAPPVAAAAASAAAADSELRSPPRTDPTPTLPPASSAGEDGLLVAGRTHVRQPPSGLAPVSLLDAPPPTGASPPLASSPSHWQHGATASAVLSPPLTARRRVQQQVAVAVRAAGAGGGGGAHSSASHRSGADGSKRGRKAAVAAVAATNTAVTATAAAATNTAPSTARVLTQRLVALPAFSATSASLALAAVGVAASLLALCASVALLQGAAWLRAHAPVLSDGGGSALTGGLDADEARFAAAMLLACTLLAVGATALLAAWSGALVTTRAAPLPRSSGATGRRRVTCVLHQHWKGRAAAAAAACSVAALSIPASTSVPLAAARVAFCALALAAETALVALALRMWHRDAQYARLRSAVAKLGGQHAASQHTGGRQQPGGPLAAAWWGTTGACAAWARALHRRTCARRPVPPPLLCLLAAGQPPSFRSQLCTFMRRAWLQEVAKLPQTVGVLLLLAAVGAVVGAAFSSVAIMSWTVRTLMVIIIVFLAAATSGAGLVAAERELSQHEADAGTSITAALLGRQLVALPAMVLQPFFFLLLYIETAGAAGSWPAQLGLLVSLSFAGGGLGMVVALLVPRSPFLATCILSVFVAVFNAFSPTFETLEKLGLSPGAAEATLSWSPVRWAAEGLLVADLVGLPDGWAAQRSWMLSQYRFHISSLTSGACYINMVLFGLATRLAALALLQLRP